MVLVYLASMGVSRICGAVDTHDDCDGKVEECREKLRFLQQAVEKIHLNNTQLMKEKAELEEKLQNMIVRADLLQSQVLAMNMTVEEYRLAVEKGDQEVENLKGEKITLEQKAKEMTMDIQYFKGLIEKQKVQIAKIQNDILILKEKNKELITQLKEQKALYQTIKDKNEELHQEKIEGEAVNANLSMRLDEAIQRQQQIERELNEIKLREADNIRVNQTCSETSQKLKEARSKAKELKQQMEKERAVHEAALKELKELLNGQRNASSEMPALGEWVRYMLGQNCSWKCWLGRIMSVVSMSGQMVWWVFTTIFWTVQGEGAVTILGLGLRTIALFTLFIMWQVLGVFILGIGDIMKAVWIMLNYLPVVRMTCTLGRWFWKVWTKKAREEKEAQRKAALEQERQLVEQEQKEKEDERTAFQETISQLQAVIEDMREELEKEKKKSSRSRSPKSPRTPRGGQKQWRGRSPGRKGSPKRQEEKEPRGPRFKSPFRGRNEVAYRNAVMGSNPGLKMPQVNALAKGAFWELRQFGDVPAPGYLDFTYDGVICDKWVNSACEVCKCRGHWTDQCYTATKTNFKKSSPVAWQDIERMRKGELKVGRLNPSSYNENGVRRAKESKQADWLPAESVARTNVVGQEEPRRKAYINAKLNGIDVHRCLVDTGSDVNVIPQSLATKLNLKLSPATLKAIRGFNGQFSRVIGEFTGQFEFGPAEEAQPTKFLVVADATCLIVGFPTLGDFHMMVDCGEGALINKATREMSICSAIETVTKNE